MPDRATARSRALEASIGHVVEGAARAGGTPGAMLGAHDRAGPTRDERLSQRRRLDISDDSEEEGPAGSEGVAGAGSPRNVAGTEGGGGSPTLHASLRADGDLEGADALTTLRLLHSRVEGAPFVGKVGPRAVAVSVLTESDPVTDARVRLTNVMKTDANYLARRGEAGHVSLGADGDSPGAERAACTERTRAAASPVPVIDLDADGRADAEEFSTHLAAEAKNPQRYGAELVRLDGFVLHSSGTSTPHAVINGEYVRSHEVINGRAVYVKTNQADSAMWWANNDGQLAWVVGRKGDAGTSKMWAYVPSLGWGPEQGTEGPWQVYSYTSKSFEAQHGITVQVPSLPRHKNEPRVLRHEDDRSSCGGKDCAASAVAKTEGRAKSRNNRASDRMRRSGDADTFLRSLLADPPSAKPEELVKASLQTQGVGPLPAQGNAEEISLAASRRSGGSITAAPQRITQRINSMLSKVVRSVFGMRFSKNDSGRTNLLAERKGITEPSGDGASKARLPKRIEKLIKQQHEQGKHNAKDILSQVATSSSNALVQYRLSELYASAPHLQDLQKRLQEISQRIEEGKRMTEGQETLENGRSALKGLVGSEYKEALNSLAMARDKQISDACAQRRILSSLQLAVLEAAASRTEAFLEEFKDKIVKGVSKLLHTSVPVQLCDLQRALHENVDYQKHWQVIAILPKSLTIPTVQRLQRCERTMLLVALQAITDAFDRRKSSIRRLKYRLEYHSLNAWHVHAEFARKIRTRVAEFQRQHTFRTMVGFFSSWWHHYATEKSNFEAEVLWMEEQVAQLQNVSQSWIEYELDDPSGQLEFVGDVLPIAGELRPHGQGVMTWRDGSQFFGEWKQGMTSGIGREVYSDGSSYIGSFEKDMRHGMGIFSTANGDTYTGNWAEGERDGLGISVEKVAFAPKHSQAGVGRTSMRKSALSVFGEFVGGQLEKRLQDPEKEHAIEEQVIELVRRAAAQAQTARTLATHIKARCEGVNRWQVLGGNEAMKSDQPYSPSGASAVSSPSSPTSPTRGRAPSMLVSPARSPSGPIVENSVGLEKCKEVGLDVHSRAPQAVVAEDVRPRERAKGDSDWEQDDNMRSIAVAVAEVGEHDANGVSSRGLESKLKGVREDDDHRLPPVAEDEDEEQAANAGCKVSEEKSMGMQEEGGEEGGGDEEQREEDRREGELCRANKVRSAACLQSHLRRAVLKSRYPFELTLISHCSSGPHYLHMATLISTLCVILICS